MCTDCNHSPQPGGHAVMWPMVNVVNGKTVHFVLCSECWRKEQKRAP